ncbi:uncharacterized protein EV420DRAFT_1599141 [Desarmillaria tabescens]|uniref:Uncharacterized protein n=1 Tax=Armillaria tabescens TaxID=1929756 RepID=A0AA39MG96_ARMTA|nr:uncharacterized protein EV420DRAFT_1599141 [Desarmillaria tabescens]KAK0433741.1 hypothetical protein EV420DRAFT_1599141 [Desarmillaria tabescens]
MLDCWVSLCAMTGTRLLSARSLPCLDDALATINTVQISNTSMYALYYLISSCDPCEVLTQLQRLVLGMRNLRC